MTRCHAHRAGLFFLVSVLALLSLPQSVEAQQYDAALLKGMKYRLIGPYRGGRALTAVGVPTQPDVYYFGAVSGGVWKTVNAGITWEPIFDDQPVSSIGSIAVAESDHRAGVWWRVKTNEGSPRFIVQCARTRPRRARSRRVLR